MQPLISIVTVTLNAGGDLARTCRSVSKQLSGNIEHIIKDGISRDDSLNGLELHPSHRIVVRRDSGIYDAMNQALEVASGKFVWFLNAGDELIGPHACQWVGQKLESGECNIVYGDYLNVFRNVIVRQPKRLTNFYLYRQVLCHQSVIMEAELIRKASGFATAYCIRADQELFLRIWRSGVAKTVHSGRVLIGYKDNGYSTWKANRNMGAAELRQLRQVHFSRTERVVYGLLLMATVPGIRQFLLRVGKGRFSRIYTWVANQLNR